MHEHAAGRLAAASWLLILAAGVTTLGMAEPPFEREPFAREPLEVPDQPPGIPAEAIPGAPPSPVLYFGPATTHQVNVTATGANVPGDAANEPSIAVNPLAPNQMAIGWRQFDT